jgi:hypothetical protein
MPPRIEIGRGAQHVLLSDVRNCTASAIEYGDSFEGSGRI